MMQETFGPYQLIERLAVGGMAAGAMRIGGWHGQLALCV